MADELKRVPQLKRKTATERGPIDPEGLGAALNWGKMLEPEAVIIKGTNGRLGALIIPQVTTVPMPSEPDLDEKGGPTSGNWGHEGRPGIRGGSAPGGGHSFFPVLDRAKMGGHSETDILGMCTLRRQELGTDHPGTRLGVLDKNDWATLGIRFKLEKAKDSARSAAATRKREARAAKEIKDREAETTRHDPASARKKLAELDRKHAKGIADKEAALAEAQDRARSARYAYSGMVMGGFVKRPGDKRFEHYVPRPKEGVDPGQMDAAKSNYEALTRDKNRKQADLDYARTQALDEMRAVVHVDSPMTIAHKYRVRGFKDPSRKDTWDAGRESFESLVSTDLHGTPLQVDFRKGGRGRSSAVDNEIKLTTWATEGVVVHELGHTLERSSPVAKASAQRFLASRTEGEATRSLKAMTGAGYRSNERTKPDKFMDPYMGKSYSWGSTEILSMGLEYMHTKPAAFAKGDPGMFDMIFTVARGQEWYPPGGGQ